MDDTERVNAMGLTLILSAAGCALLFFGIWGLTVTMPSKILIGFFPEDVQEKLQPRVNSLPFTWKTAAGWVILILFVTGYISLFVIAGIDGIRNGFTFLQLWVRFLIIGTVIKLFDIIGLDYFLLTKSHFFQHYFPETEGCEGWKQFGYNRKQQLRQIVMTLIGTLITAWICMFLQ